MTSPRNRSIEEIRLREKEGLVMLVGAEMRYKIRFFCFKKQMFDEFCYPHFRNIFQKLENL